MTLRHCFACRVRMVTALRVIGNCTLVLASKELTSWLSDQAQIFSTRLSAMVTCTITAREYAAEGVFCLSCRRR